MKRLLLLVLLLAPAALAVDVEGYVYTIDGTPIAKATVTAGAQRVTTDEDGHFTVTASADSIVKLEIRAETFPPRTLFALAGDPPLTVTLVEESADREATMRTTATAPSEKRDRVLTGIVRIGKRPLANAPVTIQPISESWVAPMTVTTDAKGRYRATVAPGRYVVAPSAELAPRLMSIHANRMYEGDSPFLADTTKSAETVADLELVATPLITGRVVDAEGKPVAGADVTAVLPGRSPFEFFHQPIVRTLPDGSFALVKPPFEERQPVELVVTPPRHSATRTAPAATIKLPRFEPVTVRVTDRAGTPLPNATVAYAATEELPHLTADILFMPHARRRRTRADAGGALTLHLTPGSYELAAAAPPKFQSGTASQTIKRSTEITIALEEGYAIRGRVRRGEQPVAGVDVRIVGRAAPIPRDRAVQTDEKGAFAFEALPRGTYQVHFFKHDELIDKMLTIDAPGEADLDLPPTATLAGRVLDDETGEAVPLFFLNIEPAEDGDGRQLRGRTDRGEQGAFAAALPVGTYKVTAGATGYLPSEAVEVQVTAAGSTPVELRLGRGATISGRVTDEEGRPVSAAHVMLVGDMGDLRRSARPVMQTGLLSAETGEDGTFTISGAETGPAQIIVRNPGFVLRRKSIEVEEQTRVDITLTRGLGLSGVVTLNGKPVAGASVGASTSAIGSDHQTATTDERGRFTLGGLVAARYTIHASYNEHNREVRDIDISERRDLVIELKGEERGVIYGTVTGLPRGGSGKIVRSHVFAQSSSHGAEGTVDGAGNYRIENAPTGSVEVVANVQSPDGTSAARKRVEVGPGQTVRVDLDVTPAATVRGRVTHNGRPAAQAHVSFSSEEHGHGAAVTNENGMYEAGLPAPGRYQIHVANVETETSYQTVREFRGSETFDIAITDQTVEGVVVDGQTGKPIPEAIVSMMLRGGAKHMTMSGETMTGDSGHFILRTSASGPHVLMASAPGYTHGSQDVTLGRSETIRARFELMPAGALRVRVVDARTGTPLEAHLLIADARGEHLPVRAQRSADGTEFVFSLAPGKYRLTAMTPGYAEKTIEVSAPGTVVMQLE